MEWRRSTVRGQAQDIGREGGREGGVGSSEKKPVDGHGEKERER